MSDVVNRGQQPNDQSADTLYVAFGKVNDKFAENDDLKQVQDATEKVTPVDADTLPLIDSTAEIGQPKLKWLSWANIKATLKTYFDTVYSTFSGSYNDLSNKPTIPSTPGQVGAEPANANIQTHIGTVGTPHVSAAEKNTWNGKSDLALGETSATAYRGDRGKTAYDHSQVTHAPSNATANDTDANLKARANHTGTQLAETISNFAAIVIASVLTGLSTTTNAAITAADTVLTALGKLQKQITDHLANHPSGISGLTTNKIPKASSPTAVNDSNLEQVPASNDLIRVGPQAVTVSSPDANSLLVSGKLYVGNGADISAAGHQSGNFAGAIKIGDAAGSQPGTIKYVSNDQDFLGYTGSVWKSLLGGGGLEVITALTASTTLSAANHTNKYIPVNSASATNITINGSLFVGNTIIAIEQMGAGIVTIVQGTGMTLNGALKTWGQYSVIYIMFKIDTVATVIGGSA